MPIDVRPSNPLPFTGRVRRLKNLLSSLPEKDREEASIVVNELIGRNIEAYVIIANDSPYETTKFIANLELREYKQIANENPELLKKFIK